MASGQALGRPTCHNRANFPDRENPMTLKRPKGPAGTLLVLEHSSKILKDNPLRDPHVRKLGVWLPPQYDEGGKRRFPVLYDLVGFTGSGLAHADWKPFGDNVPERAARTVHSPAIQPPSAPDTTSTTWCWCTSSVELASTRNHTPIATRAAGRRDSAATVRKTSAA